MFHGLSKTKLSFHEYIFPLFHMDECIESPGGANILPALEVYSNYLQLSIKQVEKPKTSFLFHAGTYQYNVMSFDLENTPATF